MPGAAIPSIYGSRIEAVAVGRANEPDKTSTSSVFEGASLSKPLFALGVLALVKSDALRLDSPIASIVDRRDETGDPRVLNITSRHALTHTTGLPSWRFEAGPLRCAFEPGSRFSYSGESVFLLQRAFEHVVGTGFAYYLRRHVLAPLARQPLPVYSPVNAASSLLTTARDYVRVASSIAKHRIMTSPQIAVTDRIAWGLGIGLERSPSGTVFHWGDNDGFKAMLVATTKRSDGAFVLTNSDGGMKPALDVLSHTIGSARSLFGWVGAMYR